MKNNNLSSKETALKNIWEWDYNNGGKIPIGVFYKIEKPAFDEEVNSGVQKIDDLDLKIRDILKSKI